MPRWPRPFIADEYRVLSVHHGYQGLFSENPDIKEFDFEHADQIFSRGGSTLIMIRFKPKDADFNTRLFEKENVKLLVTIGGDDTASTANRIAKYLKSNNIDPFFDLTHIVDRVGTGDAYAAGLIYGLLSYENEQDAVNFAAAACALKHTVEGDANLVSAEDVKRIVKGNTSGKIIR